MEGYRYAAHSSYTHHPTADKWRVIIALRKPLPPSYAGALYDFFGGRFGRGLDTACRNPAHLYFLPACPPDAISYYQHFSREGPCFDGAFLREQGKPARPREDGVRAPLISGIPTALPAVDVMTLPVSRRIKNLIKTGQGHCPRGVKRCSLSFRP